jgi:hypothetical protein
MHADITTSYGARRPSRPAPLPIPDVRAFVASPPACAIERNHAITAGYQKLGALVQDLVDPAFRRDHRSQLAPNWFAMGSYVSNAGGKNMVALDRARALLAAQADLASACAALGLGSVGERAALALEPIVGRSELTRTLSRTLCALLLVVRRQVSTVADVDARVLPRSLRRSADLLESVEARGIADKVDAVLRTAYNALADGNIAIYGDVALAGQDFFELRHASGAFASDEPLFGALGALWSPRDTPRFVSDAREVVAYCRARLGDIGALRGLASRFAHIGSGRGLAFLGAGFALYEEGRATELYRKNQLIAGANALLALREQRDVVQRAFEGREPHGVDRAEVFRLVTPFLTIPVGPACWHFSRWADAFPARRPREGLGLDRLDPQASRYNWAVFEDRWTPILDFFEHMYAKPELVWIHRFDPDPRI